MLPKINARCTGFLFFTALALTLATGCDSAREKVAAAIKPQTVEEVTASVREKIRRHEYSQACAEGVAYLNGKDDPSGKLAWALATAYAQTGGRDQAIKFTEQALKADAITPADAMSEPLLEPVRDDARFVSLLGGANWPGGAIARAKGSASASSAEQKESRTAVTIDAKGIEARAGDVVVKLSN